MNTALLNEWLAIIQVAFHIFSFICLLLCGLDQLRAGCIRADDPEKKEKRERRRDSAFGWLSMTVMLHIFASHIR